MVSKLVAMNYCHYYYHYYCYYYYYYHYYYRVWKGNHLLISSNLETISFFKVSLRTLSN
jgi:hypothetical protein